MLWEAARSTAVNNVLPSNQSSNQWRVVHGILVQLQYTNCMYVQLKMERKVVDSV